MNKVILGLLAVTALFGVALADFSYCGQQGPYTASIPKGSGEYLRWNAAGATLHLSCFEVATAGVATLSNAVFCSQGNNFLKLQDFPAGKFNGTFTCAANSYFYVLMAYNGPSPAVNVTIGASGAVDGRRVALAPWRG